MKKLIGLCLLAFSSLVGEESEPMDGWEESNYIQLLQQEIQKQNDLVKSITSQIERRDIIIPADITSQFENAYTMLNVKQTLYNNFIDTPSIKSPRVRAKLLEIFRKTIITPADLSELERLVQEERPKYLKTPSPTGTK